MHVSDDAVLMEPPRLISTDDAHADQKLGERIIMPILSSVPSHGSAATASTEASDAHCDGPCRAGVAAIAQGRDSTEGLIHQSTPMVRYCLGILEF